MTVKTPLPQRRQALTETVCRLVAPRAVRLTVYGRRRLARVVAEARVARAVDVVATWTRVHEHRAVRSAAAQARAVAHHRRERTLDHCSNTNKIRVSSL